jgi:predicted restriction endonuclease
VRDSRLLRASHIKPWADCETDAELLDVYNGLLLAAHLDAAFDSSLISFNEKGQILFPAISKKLTAWLSALTLDSLYAD